MERFRGRNIPRSGDLSRPARALTSGSAQGLSSPGNLSVRKGAPADDPSLFNSCHNEKEGERSIELANAAIVLYIGCRELGVSSGHSFDRLSLPHIPHKKATPASGKVIYVYAANGGLPYILPGEN